MDAPIGRESVVARIATGSIKDSDRAPAPDGAPCVPGAEKYETVAPIGRGGMGEVLLVNDRDLRRDVAMKVIRGEFADDPEMRRRFVAEAQATSQLEHPGIPPVHDIGLTP